jgi:hypothetical protein
MADVAHVCLEALWEVLVDCGVISHGLWPPHSPDLMPCNFYLGESLKDKVYKTNPHILEELRKSIYHKISAISKEECQRVNINVSCSYTKCIQSQGHHSQHLLQY